MAIVNRDKVLSGYNGNLESVVHTERMTNGLFVALGELEGGERDLYKVVAPSAGNIETEEFLLVCAPEVMYDERLYRKRDFVIEAGTAARAFRMAKGDVLTLTNDLFDGALPKKGDLVAPATNGSMKLTKTTKETKSTLVFKVIAEDSLDVVEGEALRIKAIKA
ncbi:MULTISPECIES: hypothetical protein [Bacillus cereus group]|uniref:hypothetical protein n=1 Tax=Bacillus cereus group TaxID=86661 RepID=UPI000B44B7A1|nr:hypothetical protein [Bacillus thuringiensis]MEB9470810.1 hypothetical protein [Bacillus cereus]MRA82392.1 hypothetical protein [Bacillus thuringiensis]OUA16535.1 hypothetical protein BK776_30925 [Bacillus thuringiensis serovar aizawai]